MAPADPPSVADRLGVVRRRLEAAIATDRDAVATLADDIEANDLIASAVADATGDAGVDRLRREARAAPAGDRSAVLARDLLISVTLAERLAADRPTER